MNATAATSEEVFAVVKRWAQARGFVNVLYVNGVDEWNEANARPGWHVDIVDKYIRFWWRDKAGVRSWWPSPAVALAVAILMESDAAPVRAMWLLDAIKSVTARDRLAVHADELLASGDPIGELLTWALNLWMPKLRVADHQPVTGDSVELLRAHTAKVMRWLEWLTWGQVPTANDARQLAAELTRGLHRRELSLALRDRRARVRGRFR